MQGHSTHNARKRVITAVAILFVITLIYTVAIPTVVANEYLDRLDTRTAEVKTKLKTVANDAENGFFANPDVPLAERQAKIANAQRIVHDARAALDELERTNTLSRLPGSGFVGDYHTAVVRQERANNIVRQSKEVLEAYDSALSFLSRYTELQHRLDDHLTTLNKVRDFNTLAGKGQGMTRVATQVRADQKTLSALVVPSDFASLQANAVTTFGEAATGYERLARGLNARSDPQIYAAVKSLETVADKNQVGDKDLLVSLAVNSAVLRQLAELPEKVEHAQGR